MKTTSRSIAVAALVALALAGCQTYPAQLLLDPARFENDSVRIDWAIGINFFKVKLMNTTDAQLDLDLVNSAVVSVDGEARSLAAMTGKDAAIVPPKAYLILDSRAGAIYGTDILGRFNAETEDKYQLPLNANADDRLFLKGHSGENLRLYLTATIKGKRTILDIPFKIAGASRVQQSASEQQQPAAAKQ